MSTNAVMNLACGDHEVQGWYGQNQYCYPYRPVGCWPTQVVTTNFPIIVQDTTKKAFAIAKNLVKSRFMNADKIEEFIELVEMIEKEL